MHDVTIVFIINVDQPRVQTFYYRVSLLVMQQCNRFNLYEKVVFTFFAHYLHFTTSTQRPWEK